MCATVIAYLRGESSVTRVTELSGVGRNTFYECFDDFEHALETARREELQRVRRGLTSLRAAAHEDEIAALCRAWLELIDAEPLSALVVLEPLRGERGSALRSVFQDALERTLKRAVSRNDPLLSHSAACAEASGRALALLLLNPAELSRSASTSRLSEAVSALTRSVRRLVGS